MARVAATASLGIKKTLGDKKGWTQYDSASPHHSFTVEREFDESLSDEELQAKGEQLHKLAETMVQKKMNEELERIKEMPSK